MPGRPMDGMGQNVYPLALEVPGVSTSCPAIPSHPAPVAQWIEYCPPKAGVARSNRVRRAKFDQKPMDNPPRWVVFLSGYSPQ